MLLLFVMLGATVVGALIGITLGHIVAYILGWE